MKQQEGNCQVSQSEVRQVMAVILCWRSRDPLMNGLTQLNLLFALKRRDLVLVDFSNGWPFFVFLEASVNETSGCSTSS